MGYFDAFQQYAAPYLSGLSDADQQRIAANKTATPEEVNAITASQHAGFDPTETGWAGPVGGKIGFPGRGGTTYPAAVMPGPSFINPGATGNPSDVTFVAPQLPDPDFQYKTHYNTGAPIYWDPSGVTGGTMGKAGQFTPTGGTVKGLGQALGLSSAKGAYGGGQPFNSGYDLPAGYADAIARGPAAAVDFLQSGPRGADGLTDAQRHLVSQIKAPSVAVPGANQFQEFLDAIGSSQTPTGTSTSGGKITTPGGTGWRGGSAMTPAQMSAMKTGHPVGYVDSLGALRRAAASLGLPGDQSRDWYAKHGLTYTSGVGGYPGQTGAQMPAGYQRVSGNVWKTPKWTGS